MSLEIKDMKDFFMEKNIYYFIVSLVLNYIMFMVAKSSPSKTLGIFAVANIALLILMLLTEGSVSLWAILSVGLFNSIMFSNIFTLAISRLGKYTSQGSSLLVMMILGGAIVPPLQGSIADEWNIHSSFALPILCYIYLVWYGFKGCKISKK